jgi:hypothetical protein
MDAPEATTVVNPTTAVSMPLKLAFLMVNVAVPVATVIVPEFGLLGLESVARFAVGSLVVPVKTNPDVLVIPAASANGTPTQNGSLLLATPPELLYVLPVKLPG